MRYEKNTSSGCVAQPSLVPKPKIQRVHWAVTALFCEKKYILSKNKKYFQIPFWCICRLLIAEPVCLRDQVTVFLTTAFSQQLSYMGYEIAYLEPLHRDAQEGL